jgi:hypothetical protein
VDQGEERPEERCLVTNGGGGEGDDDGDRGQDHRGEGERADGRAGDHDRGR